jgi:hypothetical protein
MRKKLLSSKPTKKLWLQFTDKDLGNESWKCTTFGLCWYLYIGSSFLKCPISRNIALKSYKLRKHFATNSVKILLWLSSTLYLWFTSFFLLSSCRRECQNSEKVVLWLTSTTLWVRTYSTYGTTYPFCSNWEA